MVVLVSLESDVALSLRPSTLTLWVAQLGEGRELTATELMGITGMARGTVRRGVAELVALGLSSPPSQPATPPDAPQPESEPDPGPVRLETLQLGLQVGAEPVYWPIVASLPGLDRLEAMGLLKIAFDVLDGLTLRQYQELMGDFAPRAHGGEVEVLRKMAEYAELPSFRKRKRAALTYRNWLTNDYAKQRGRGVVNATSEGISPGPYDFDRLSTGAG